MPRSHGMLVVLPTGSGKSLCFMLPALLARHATLVIYPLLGLMNDQKRRFESAGISCVILRGGQTPQQRYALFEKLSCGEAKVLITNAECLSDSRLLHQIARIRFSMAVVDEAHTIVQWGTTFRPSYAAVGMLLEHLGIPLKLAFTATASEEIAKGLQHLLFLDRTPRVISAPTDRPNLIYHAEETLSPCHTISRILADPSHRPALIFAPTRRKCAQLAMRLGAIHHEWDVRYYHGGLSKDGRKEIERWYLASASGILVATCAFGLGMDKKDIRTVIHTAMPGEVESYLQESGRAGRDGKESHAWMLFPSPPQSALGHCFSKDACIRKSLMNLMGQELETCNGCDVCLSRRFPFREGEREIRNLVRFRPLLMKKRQAATWLKEDVLTTWEMEEILEAIMQLIKEKKLGVRFGRLFATFSFAWARGTCHTPLGGTHGNKSTNQGRHAPRKLPLPLWHPHQSGSS